VLHWKETIMNCSGILRGSAVALTAAGLLLLGFAARASVFLAQDNRGFSPYVDGRGAIRLPEGFREKWVHLGSWFVPDEKAPGYGVHDVYTQPETVAAYKRDGEFPDSAVLVKEIRKIRARMLTTGPASWAGENAVWFVMIRDKAGRFRNHPNWGDGWGWALFEAKDPAKNVSLSYRKDCTSCHTPARKTNWVFVEGYPTLR
jgi:cytochrome c